MHSYSKYRTPILPLYNVLISHALLGARYQPLMPRFSDELDIAVESGSFSSAIASPMHVQVPISQLFIGTYNSKEDQSACTYRSTSSHYPTLPENGHKTRKVVQKMAAPQSYHQESPLIANSLGDGRYQNNWKQPLPKLHQLSIHRIMTKNSQQQRMEARLM